MSDWAVICAGRLQNVTDVVAMFTPKWLPRRVTGSPPPGEPAIGLIEATDIR